MSKGKNKIGIYGGARALRDQFRGNKRFNPLREGKKSERMYWSELKVAIDVIITKIDDVNKEVEAMVTTKELLEKIPGMPQEAILKNMVNHFRHDMKAALTDISTISQEIKPRKGWASGIIEVAEFAKYHQKLTMVRDTFALLAQPTMVAITTLMSSVTLPKEEQGEALKDVDDAVNNVTLIRNDIIAEKEKKSQNEIEIDAEHIEVIAEGELTITSDKVVVS